MQLFFRLLLRLILIFILTAPALCQIPQYERALVVKMRMVSCSDPPRRGFVQELVNPPVPPWECPEYDLEGSRVTYRVRPRRDVLVPVGQEIQFRMKKRDFLLLTEDANKEIPCAVVSMSLRKVSEEDLPVEEVRKPAKHPRVCLGPGGEMQACAGR